MTQYVLLAVVACVLFAVFKTVMVAGTRANAGMRLWRHCQKRHQELIHQGLDSREALITVSRERYPYLSHKVHERIVDKCQDIWRLANFFNVVLDNPRPKTWGRTGRLVDEEAKALIQSTVITREGRISTDFTAAAAILEDKKTGLPSQKNLC